MEIIFDKKAQKFIESQDKPTKQRIKKAVEGLTEDPPKGDIKVMQGYTDNRMRLRVGKYRIIYRYANKVAVVLHVMKIDSRGDIYKH